MNRFSIDADKLAQVIALVQAADSDATEQQVIDALDADWPNADEHQEWLNTANAAEIAEWTRFTFDSQAVVDEALSD